MLSKPSVLVSNDDGISAPGIVALVHALGSAGFCEVFVSAPTEERSASSHAITLGQQITATPTTLSGAVQAFAVNAKPADCAMLGLRGPLFQVSKFDLVVSGINRGDNLGLHVIYSGTVGAAREAACKGVPAVAVSLDNYKALTPDGFAAAAAYTTAFVKAILCPESSTASPPLSHMTNAVINLNVPAQGPFQGFYLAHQGSGIVDLDFQQVNPAETPSQKEGHMMETVGNEQEASTPHKPGQNAPMRTFRSYAGAMHWDATPGCDSWAVKQGWVSVTPLGLRSDICLKEGSDSELAQGAHAPHPGLIPTVAEAMRVAAQNLGVSVGGMPKL